MIDLNHNRFRDGEAGVHTGALANAPDRSASAQGAVPVHRSPQTHRRRLGQRVASAHVWWAGFVVWLGWLWAMPDTRAAQPLPGKVVYETTSAYHHIRVVDHLGLRTLSFDDSCETRMSLANPLSGHFQYTEYFHVPWLWNTNIQAVLMIGLGGGSTQRSYAHYHPDVAVDTVEIDPVVFRVARQYFQFEESPRQKVHIEDGRVFLRRTQSEYDAIMLDAYVQSRYGAALPYHLVTKEFFDLTKNRLTTNGVVVFNCMGTLAGWQADLVGSIYRTMKTVFPKAYLFPATDSLNVVLVATKSSEEMTPAQVRTRASQLVRSGRVRLPAFSLRVQTFRTEPPPNLRDCPLLVDDYAPVDGLLCDRKRGGS